MSEEAEASGDPWMHLLAQECAGEDAIQGAACPNCASNRALRLKFVAYANGSASELAMAYLWCSSCLVGVAVGRTPVPANAEVIPFTQMESVIPEYRLLQPGA